MKLFNKKSEVINIDGRQIEYLEQGEGFPIIGFHGTPGGYDQSGFYFRRLAKNFKLITFSRPGYLKTPLGSGISFEEQAHLASGLMSELGYKSYSIAGVSGGSPSAIHLSVISRENVKSMILDAPVTKPYVFRHSVLGSKPVKKIIFNDFTSFLLKNASKYFPRIILRKVIDNQSSLRRTEKEKLFDYLVHTDTCLETLKKVIYTTTPFSSRKKGLQNDLSNFKQLDLPLDKITVPVLVTHGTADSLVPYSYGNYLVHCCNSARMQAVKNGFHSLSFHPEAEKHWKNKIDFLQSYAI